MKQPFMKLCLFFFLAAFCTLTAGSQNLTGIWRGNFITDNGDNYKFEIQIKQSGTAVSGVSYSYLTTVFYGKATLTGSYNRSGKTALIREIKTTELRMSSYSSACIMKCVFEYSKSGNEEFLEGIYTSKHEEDGYGHKKGEDCGGGRVSLRKVTTSDFYIEPFLRKNLTPTPNVRRDTAKTKTSPSVATRKPAVNTNAGVRKPATKTTTTKTNSSRPDDKTVKEPVAIKPKSDTVGKVASPKVNTIPTVKGPVPNVLKTRTNELVKTLVVSDEHVTVKLYDNGEIDDDTISVYLDKKLVLASKRLTATALVVKLKMDENDPDHELVMVAENLGRIPPNTSLMVVECGEQRFDVRITSTEQKNAVVRFRYERPK